MNRPIVSTPVAGFRDQPADRVVTASPQQLPEAVLRVLSAPPAPRTPAEVPTWSDRVRQMQQVLTRVRAAATPR